MATSKRKRKEKARRQAATAQRDRGRLRRAEEAAAARQARQRAERTFDPQTPADEVASLVGEAYGNVWLTAPILVERLAGDRPMDDVLAIAKYLAQNAGDDTSQRVFALAFAAHARHRDGDYRGARQALDEAAQEPGGFASELPHHLASLGRPADVLDLVGGDLPGLITDPRQNRLYTEAIEQAYRRLNEDPVRGECPCGTAKQWTECCKPRDTTIIERFGDRDRLYVLRDALRNLIDDPRLTQPVAEHVAEWLNTADAGRWPDEAQDALERLAIEHAWLIVSMSGDDDADTLLTILAQDPATDAAVAADAEVWRDEVRYGLWQVVDPHQLPGLELMDVGTGQSVYAAFPPEQRKRLARWTVLLGALVPIGGAWRPTGTMIPVAPQEADSLYETLQSTTYEVLSELAGADGSPVHPPQRAPFGQAEPHSVYMSTDPLTSPEHASIISKTAAIALPIMLRELHDARATPPTMTNTDGDVMEIVTAKIRVAADVDVVERITAHPDFEANDDAGGLTWYGRTVPVQQAQAMLAEAAAQFGAAQAPETNEPQRWVRGTLNVAGDEIRVEVNSRRRLERLVKILTKYGAEPEIVDESRVDPAQDLPWQAAYRPARGGAADASEGWENQWLDDSVPALDGLTPRQAVDSEYHEHLEALLRQFEYDADLSELNGEKGVDTDWLRSALDMDW